MHRRFRDRGYPEEVIKQSERKAAELRREDLLEPKQKSTSEEMRIIGSFDDRSQDVRNILMKHWDILMKDGDLKDFLPTRPLITYRRGRNLRDSNQWFIISDLRTCSVITTVEQKKNSFYTETAAQGHGDSAAHSPPRTPGSSSDRHSDERPLVTTKYGRLQGITVRIKETARTVNAFYGVPFAKSPVGPLRFEDPKAPEPWSSVRDASQYPPICLQEDITSQIIKGYYQSSFKLPPSSEDCLYLNVFTPSHRHLKSKLPVMTFIHGGGLFVWSASMFDGSALSALENVVAVAIQYRLGIVGFFSTTDNQLPGNYGLKDQIAALQWIQENIAAFGGDPSSVTIFGESAGAISVSALVLSPLSKGLFHRAIAESGAVTLPISVASSKSEDLIHNQNVVAEISGCDLASIADCLKKKSEEDLLVIAKEMGPTPLPLRVDGVVIPKPVEEMLADKEVNKVPFMTGINNQEFGFVIPTLYNVTGISEGMTREAAALILQNLPLRHINPKAIPFIIDEYLGDIDDPREIRDRFLDLCGDAIFVIPALRLAKLHRDAGLPVYFYEYKHPPSLLAHVRPDYIKADHTDELLFVFGGPFLRDGVLFAGPATDAEKALSRNMMRYWANFARTGDPNSPGLTTWPPYGAGEHYLGINLQQKASSKLKEEKFRFWTEILPEKIRCLEDD
ncbi:fatty acyl-CoA hydrolase precursor, medium chain-like [Eleutherodactylus coqui]|uniref:fatty acyl-CoA hydrolase precursor, medium chain-like n=1 Tax=Eleutherodactylus coqui TaxID=57060 RepID=UPI003462259A